MALRKNCALCGATVCDPTDSFHDFLRRHDLRPECWSGVGDGWLPLLDRLVVDLRAAGWTRRKVSQVKEKFGQLRFYASGLNAAMAARIEAAAEESSRTCEDCGEPALHPMPRDGLLMALCQAHRRERLQDRKW